MMLDSIIIGAGQAGLGISYFLQQSGFKHIVFEKGRIGESWLSMRWDSFKLNTPNSINILPGLSYEGTEPDGFWGVGELIDYFQRYVDHFSLPVKTGITVTSVKRAENNSHFIVKTKEENKAEETVTARTVVAAAGILRVPNYPSINRNITQKVASMHSSDYRSADLLPPGAVVVVGSGQSGCQIAEDLLSNGRTVYLCTSKVGRVPRRYLGKDIVDWWIDKKFWNVKYESLEDKSISRIPQPQISGVGRYGHTVSLQYLAEKGAVILGRLNGIEGSNILLNDDAEANIKFADGFSQMIKDDIDSYVKQNNIKAMPSEDDPADIPDPEARCASHIRELNIQKKNIGTIIWATGFKGDFDWLNLPAFDENGKPVHQRGISPVQGLYFIGFPWLNDRKSGIIYGIEEDARFIADDISARLG